MCCFSINSLYQEFEEIRRRGFNFDEYFQGDRFWGGGKIRTPNASDYAQKYPSSFPSPTNLQLPSNNNRRMIEQTEKSRKYSLDGRLCS